MDRGAYFEPFGSSLEFLKAVLRRGVEVFVNAG